MNSPNLLVVGQQVILRLDDGLFTFTIVKPFTPFTSSQALLAHCPTFSLSPVILKLYDPRYYCNRFSNLHNGGWARPWSPAVEAAAAADPRPLHWGPQRFIIPEELEEDDDEDEPDPATVEPKAALRHAARWEKLWQERCLGNFERELAAYNRLKSLWGSVVPELLGVGQYLPSEPRYIDIHALVLQYIEGVTFSDAPAAVISASLIAQLHADVLQLAQCGVVHNDLNAGNIILTPAHAPQRAFIIDFGQVAVRGTRDSDEKWDMQVQNAGLSFAVPALLIQKGIPWHPSFHVMTYKLQ